MKYIKAFIQKIKLFFLGVWSELKNVIWPDLRTSTISTSLVILVVSIISFFLSIIDFLLTRVIKFILR